MEKRRVNSLILTGIVSSLYAFSLAFTDYELYHNDGVIGKAILIFVIVAITVSAPIKAFRKICGLLGA